ncbi:MAG: transporter permease [Rhodoglobus sp.]|nr:transporter permease [Rhodoglobus sp.]
MVAQFLRLKLTLLANNFRRGPGQLAGMVIGLLYGLGLAAVVTAGLGALRLATPDIARVILIVFGAIVVLAFLLLPLAFGVDDTIDPRKFTLFGIKTGRLALSLVIAGAVSVPALVVTIFSIAQVVTWSRGTVPVLFSLLAAVLIVPTCVLGARVSAGLAAAFFSSRRSRDASGIVLVLVLAIAAPLVALGATTDWQAQGLPVVRRIAAVVSWTPFGAAWSAPGDAALGRLDIAWIKIAIAVAFLLVLWFVWRALVADMLVRPQRETAPGHYAGLGWFERLPATPLGAIAARSLSYWGRDARYRVSLAVIPIVPIVMVVALLIAGVPAGFIVWLPVPIMCLFLGWTVHNDIAYDSSAFWAHVSADTKGTDDRWGRIVPALLVGIPLVLVGSFTSVLVVGDYSIFPGLVGLSLCVLLVALGISSVISAGFPYPAVHPGDSPFAQPQAAGTSGPVIQSLSFLVAIVLSSPVVVLVFFFPALPSVQYLGLGLGAVVGIGALVGGVYWGGHIVDRRAPELLAFTLQN